MRERPARLRGAALLLIAIIVSVMLPGRVAAQIVDVPSEQHINTDSLKRAFADQHYYFGLYKDNYFIFGPPVNKTPDKRSEERRVGKEC